MTSAPAGRQARLPDGKGRRKAEAPLPPAAGPRGRPRQTPENGKKRKYPQFPGVAAMEAAALPWAMRRPYYSSDELKQWIKRRFRIGPPEDALRLASGALAWRNHVDWLAAKWTREGLHTKRWRCFYFPTQKGRLLALDLKAAKGSAKA